MMVHVPTILLSAAAEFDQAYDKGSNIKPKLSQISEYDQRAKSSSWYQPPVDAWRPGISKGTLQAKNLRCYHQLRYFVYSCAHRCQAAMGTEAPALSPNQLRLMPKLAESLQDVIHSVLRCLLQRPSTVHSCSSAFGVRSFTTLYEWC
jgi:hypothetical protein